MWDIGYAPNLTDLQLRAIALTIQGHRDTQTARILSINRRTLWQWKTFDDDYRKALASARLQLHVTTADRCQNIALKATVVLAKFLDDPTDNIRLRAAQILLNLASRFKPISLQQCPLADSPNDSSDDSPDDRWPMPVMEPKVG